MPVRTFSLGDDACAVIDAAPNKSRFVSDAVRWVSMIELNGPLATELDAFLVRMERNGVANALSAMSPVVESAFVSAHLAHQFLSACGWGGIEMLAAARQATGFSFMYGHPLGAQLRVAMLACVGPPVPTDRWNALAEHLTADAEQARAVIDLARVVGLPGGAGSKLERTLLAQP